MQITSMEARCDDKLWIQDADLQSKHADALKELAVKFTEATDRKVSETQALSR